MELRYFLGIDGGGSKCDAALIREDGCVLGWGRSGATSYRPVDDCATAICSSVGEALAEATPREVWVAHTWLDHGLHAWLRSQDVLVAQLERVQEWDIAYMTAGRRWGVAVHAGTGSWVQCRMPGGRAARIGGMGPFFGDEGSGWDLGFRGIKAALRSGWSRETRTSLAEAVPRALGVSRLLEAVVGDRITSGRVTRAQIASLAPVVLEEAAAGDQVAMRVVDEAAGSLAEMCRLLLEEMGVVGEGYPLIGAAGVIQNSALYWRILREKILHHDPTLRPEVAPFKMAVGAAMLAMRSAGVPITDDLRERISATQAAFPVSQVPTLQPQAQRSSEV
ncbi:MAG: N-acetylglucosamine kinase [Armatimonadota bacterium]|jgi:N-acetylglucosamine kinase-like BadF-type ATPase